MACERAAPTPLLATPPPPPLRPLQRARRGGPPPWATPGGAGEDGRPTEEVAVADHGAAPRESCAGGAGPCRPSPVLAPRTGRRGRRAERASRTAHAVRLTGCSSPSRRACRLRDLPPCPRADGRSCARRMRGRRGDRRPAPIRFVWESWNEERAAIVISCNETVIVVHVIVVLVPKLDTNPGEIF
jgi:hypothetical protein